MVEIQFDDRGDLLDYFLDFLPGAQGGLGDFEDVYHGVWEDYFVDLEVDVLVAQGLDMADVTLDAHVVEDVDGEVDDLGLFEFHAAWF